jgi:hypothetical protein
MADNSGDKGSWSGVSALAAVVALGLTWFIADRQEGRLDQQEERLDRQEEQQYANNVYVGEAPDYFEHKIEGQQITWVVINATGTELYDVWVEGKENDKGERTSINIDGIQRCTMYSLDAGFEPTGVHFKDPHGVWYRSLHGPLRHDYQPMPDPDTANSPAYQDVQDCSA